MKNELKQTYLIGPTLRLRAIEESDAACEPSWRQSWFPRARAVSEDKIEEDHGQGGDERTLVAERLSDGVIVGSLFLWFDGAFVYLRPFTPWWLDFAQADAVMAEMTEVAIPHLIAEGGAITVQCFVPSGFPLLEATFDRIGTRCCFRHREGLQLGGQRRDVLGFQTFNPKTASIFGDPEIPVEGPVEREVRNPAPRAWPAITTPPTGAVLVGERVYLRMFTPEDGAIMREASLIDTEFAHEPRFPRSALASNARFRKESDAAVPSKMTFAVVLLENDELLGRNELDWLDLVNRSAETGTELFRPEYRGQGYGTEAKHLLLSYAFDILNLHMVWSFVWEENPRSRAALLKQGYREAGGIPWRGFHHGVPSGDWTFDLLATEWQAARQ